MALQNQTGKNAQCICVCMIIFHATKQWTVQFEFVWILVAYLREHVKQYSLAFNRTKYVQQKIQLIHNDCENASSISNVDMAIVGSGYSQSFLLRNSKILLFTQSRFLAGKILLFSVKTSVNSHNHSHSHCHNHQNIRTTFVSAQQLRISAEKHSVPVRIR